MTTNNIFQNNQNNAMNNYSNNWNGNNMNMNQSRFYNGGYTPKYEPSMIPVKIIYSVDQISSVEIPTNGMPALFPFHDGSKIVARCLAPDGRFQDSVYVLEDPSNQNTNDQNSNVNTELLKRIEVLENNLDSLLKDLYGSKNQPSQEGENK